MEWSALPPMIRLIFVVGGGFAVLMMVAVWQVNRAYYMLQVFATVSGGSGAAAGTVTVGLITRPGRRYSLRGITVQADRHLYHGSQVRLSGTWSLSERQIARSLRLLRDGSEEHMFWGPRDKIRCAFRQQEGEMALAVRNILGGYAEVTFNVDGSAANTLIRAFEALQQAPSKVIIDA